MIDGAVAQERVEAAAAGIEQGRQAPERLSEGETRGRRVRTSGKTTNRLAGDEAAVDQRGQARADLPLPEACQQQGDVFVARDEATRGPERRVQSLVHQPRHLGFVGDVEARVQVGF